MRIPLAIDERSAWLDRTRQQLRRSLDQRRGHYGSWRTWYLHGGFEWGARYNKIGPQLNTLSSYLYSPRSVRFGLNAGPLADEGQLGMYEAVSDRLRSLWGESGADQHYAHGALWSLVYGCEVQKFGWGAKRPRCDAVGAGNFGVWRDDLPGLEGQQALLHTFRLDVDTVRGWLIGAGMPEMEAERWIRRWGEGKPAAHMAQGTLAIGAQNPIVWNGSAPGTVAGGVADWGSTSAVYDAASDTPTLEIEEIWAMDDRTHDYRIFQTVEHDLILSDRKNDFLPHHHPFVQMTVDPIDDYFWGYSTVAQLIPLQAWREKRMNQLDRLFARQANPPMVFSGFMGGVSDEKAAAVMRRGGLLANSQTPSAKVDLLTPSINELSFTEIGEIDQMFNETLGLTAALQGASTGGERGGEHARAVMSAGAGRLTRRMMNVERAVAEGASLLLGLARRYDDTMLVTEDGMKFTLAMLPGDANVEVASHSASPLFAGQAQQQAEQLMELGVIDKEDFLDLADPPMAQALKQRLKKREAQQAQQMQQAIASVPEAERGSLLGKIFGGRSKH